ncbi:zinc-ribbon domain-containing protein [Phormidium tenue FACHB-886]|nr:zinc-ribbon domain-containing protein [Phormidium tenue FACHB-886]
MAYGCELGNGQSLYLDCSGDQTAVALASSSAGQQQQASQNLKTGSWTAIPEVFQIGSSLAIKIQTAEGDRWLRVQGGSIGTLNALPDLSQAQPIPLQQTPSAQPMQPMRPIEPMQPMQPLKMGDMQMSLNPMEMRMGNLEMRMGSPAKAAPRFCTQCGASVQAGDRFCATCGNQLGRS